MHLLPSLVLLTLFSCATGQNIGPTRGGDKRLNKEDTPSNLNQIELLHFAIAKKKEQEVYAMLNNSEIDPNIITDDGRSPLLRAAFSGFHNIVEALLKHPKINVKTVDGKSGFNALHCAAFKNHAKTVQVILTDGRINPKESTDKEHVQGLPKVGKKKRAKGEGDANEKSQLQQFGYGGNSQTMSFTPLMIAANNGGDRVLRALIKDGRADIDELTATGDHLITLAARGGHAAVVQTLLDLGVDVNIHSDHGETPLWSAASEGHANVVEVLLKEKNIDLKAGTRHSPLSEANWNQREDVVQLLLHAHGRVPASALKKKIQIDDIFTRVDMNKDGALDAEEMTVVLYEHFSKDNEMEHSTGMEIITKYDSDGDNHLGMQELTVYLKFIAHQLDLRLDDLLPKVLKEVIDQGKNGDQLQEAGKKFFPLGFGDSLNDHPELGGEM